MGREFRDKNNNKKSLDKDPNQSSANTENTESIFRQYINKSNDIIELNDEKHNPFDDNQSKSPQEAYKPKLNTNNNKYHSQYSYSHNEEERQNFVLSDHLWRPEVAAEDYLFYFQSGVQHRTIRKLRAGKIRIEASLDLHQMNKEQARLAFSNFISDCYLNEMRCVCVIHGKGSRGTNLTPLLKNLVNHWLHDINIVLGFCSCPSNMGGTGAVLVLLQRNVG